MDASKKAKFIEDGFEIYGHRREPCDTEPEALRKMVYISSGAMFDLCSSQEVNTAVLTISTEDGHHVLRVDMEPDALLDLFKLTRQCLSKLGLDACRSDD